jgi:hypothetical protein
MAQAEDSVFDEIKDSFQNFIERVGELIGFDADQYINRQTEEPSSWFTLRKSTLVTLAELLISVFFIFDALEKTRDTSKMANVVSHALHARETTLANAGLPFKFTGLLEQNTIFWILRISGLV